MEVTYTMARKPFKTTVSKFNEAGDDSDLNYGRYGRLDQLERLDPDTLATAPGLAAFIAGLRFHYRRLNRFTAVSCVDRRVLAREVDLKVKLGRARAMMKDRFPDVDAAYQLSLVSVEEWGAVFGPEAAVIHAAIFVDGLSKSDAASLAAAFRDLDRLEFEAERLRAVKCHRDRVEAAARECRLARARRRLYALMPKCLDVMRGVPRFLATDIGRTTRDPRKAGRRATHPAAGGDGLGNGWDDIIRTNEEIREDLA